MDVFNSLLPSCSFSVLVFFSFLPFSTFDIHRYRPVFSVNLFLVFGFSFSLSVILSLCLPFSLFFCLFFLTVQSANGIITSPSVLDNHQAPPITAFFFTISVSFPSPCRFSNLFCDVSFYYGTVLHLSFSTSHPFCSPPASSAIVFFFFSTSPFFFLSHFSS